MAIIDRVAEALGSGGQQFLAGVHQIQELAKHASTRIAHPPCPALIGGILESIWIGRTDAYQLLTA